MITRLAEESRLRRRLRASPWGLIGMLALMLVVERGFRRHESDLLEPGHWDWRFSRTASTGEAVAKAKILCFGDSLVQYGVLPPFIEEAGGESTYNLAVCGGMPPTSYYLFRRALRAGARPAVVLIGHSPLSLRRDPRSSELYSQWPDAIGVDEAADLAWATGDANLFGNVFAARVLTSFRDRAEIRAWLLQALTQSQGRLKRSFATAQFLRNRRVNRGGFAMPHDPKHEEFGEFCRTFLGHFDVDPINAVFLDRLLALAAEHRVKVIWVMPPITAEVQILCDRSGLESKRTAFIQSLQRRHPGLGVLDGRRSRYGRAQFAKDPIHLNSTGASVFSLDVAEALPALLVTASPGWSELPCYRSRTTSDVEDLDESAAALALAARKLGAARK